MEESCFYYHFLYYYITIIKKIQCSEWILINEWNITIYKSFTSNEGWRFLILGDTNYLTVLNEINMGPFSFFNPTSKHSPETARHPNGRHNSPHYPNGRLNPRTAFHAVFQPKHPNAPLEQGLSLPFGQAVSYFTHSAVLYPGKTT